MEYLMREIAPMKLVNRKTGTEIKVGDYVITFQDKKVLVIGIFARAGKILVLHESGFKQEYWPFVIGAKFIREEKK